MASMKCPRHRERKNVLRLRSKKRFGAGRECCPGCGDIIQEKYRMTANPTSRRRKCTANILVPLVPTESNL
jgi:hypothetical protein